MTELAMGFTVQKTTLPSRGERVAAWVTDRMKATGLTVGELAFAARVDKRDLRRLLSEPHSCGWRLEDDLAAYFGWDFTEAVMTPVHGADPLTAREKAIEQRLAQAAALHARVEREREVRTAAQTHLAGVARSSPAPGPRAGGSGRSFDPKAPQGA